MGNGKSEISRWRAGCRCSWSWGYTQVWDIPGPSPLTAHGLPSPAQPRAELS